MKVTTTTLPRSSLSESRRPSWAVRVNAGAGPIFESRSPSSALWLSPDARQPTTSRTMRMLRYQPRLIVTLNSPYPHASSPSPPGRGPGGGLWHLPLQLLLQLVEEAPVGTLRDNFLRGALDHPGLV